MTLFAPLKAPNDLPPFDTPLLRYDKGVVASYKKDGNRILIVSGQMFSSSMKTPRNRHLKVMLHPLVQLSEDMGCMFDMECWSPSCPHHAELSGWINSFDQYPPYDDIQFAVFDGAPYGDFEEQCRNMPFGERIEFYTRWVRSLNNPTVIPLRQIPLHNAQEAAQLYQMAIAAGEEGLMLRHTQIWREGSRWRGGWYKHGRATMPESIMFKAKNYETLDGVITGVIQRRKIRADWPRTYNAAGLLENPLEQAAYELAPMVGAFVIEAILDNGEKVKSEVMFGKGFDHTWRLKAWAYHRDDPQHFIGRHVEVTHMPHGAMDDGRLRAGRLIRFRKDLDT